MGLPFAWIDQIAELSKPEPKDRWGAGHTALAILVALALGAILGILLQPVIIDILVKLDAVLP